MLRIIKSKIYPRAKLAKAVAKLKKSGKTIGLTNGVFDILHLGHVRYLEQAKSRCDVLVVSINTNASVRQNKGDKRPINDQKERASVIAALESVDYVTFHSEKKMKTALKVLKPDIYIKGKDYSSQWLRKYDNWEGQVALIPIVRGRSTTSTIEKILHVYKK